MRLFVLLVLIFSGQLVFAVSPSEKVEQLSAQLAPLWSAIRPVCSMSLAAEMQQAVLPRLSFLDEKLIAHELVDHVAGLPSQALNPAWSSQVWATLEQLESMALQADERENLREYYFKLQTQTPNAQRATKVTEIQNMSLQLNLSLRKELWKTCHGLGLSQMPVEQMESVIEQRWLKQAPRVKKQLQRELGAFYFYTLRQVANTELEVFVKFSQQLQPWVDTTQEKIESYFKGLRTELLQMPLAVVSQPVAAPFPAVRAWNPASSARPFGS